MERPYMFFHTGPAFCVAIVVLAGIAAVCGVVLSLLPQIRILQFVAVFAVSASMLWIPFWLDYRLVRKRRVDKS